MAAKFPVMYGSTNVDRFIIQKPNEQLIFNRSQSGLHFHDIGDQDISMVTTVAGNRKGYTDREYAAAQESKSGLALVGNTSPRDYMSMVREGLIRNCPVTPDAVTAANNSLGPDVAYLKGKLQGNCRNP